MNSDPHQDRTTSARRTGDAPGIPGDYQARALREGVVVQRFWHALKFDLINRVLPPQPQARILDVGCGSGVIADFLGARARRVDAVDANPLAIEYARSSVKRANVHFHRGCVDELPFEQGTFDQAYCLELIEHVYEPQAHELLGRLGLMLKPAGTLLVTTPNYHSLWPVIEWGLDTFRLAPRLKDDQHVFKLSLGRLRTVGREVGLEEVRSGRFCGLAPFASALSWSLASRADRLENRFGNPLGNILFAVWRRGGRNDRSETGPTTTERSETDPTRTVAGHRTGR